MRCPRCLNNNTILQGFCLACGYELGNRLIPVTPIKRGAIGKRLAFSRPVARKGGN